MLKFAIAAVLLAHGIGHSLGLLQVFKIATVDPSWAGDSWLLTGVAGQTLTQAVGLVLWSAALLGFVALAAVVMGQLPAAWWPPLAIASSALSLAAVALFPTAFPTVSTIGAIVVDVAVLVAVIAFRWSPAGLAAS
jgi:hypothetical protein